MCVCVCVFNHHYCSESSTHTHTQSLTISLRHVARSRRAAPTASIHHNKLVRPSVSAMSQLDCQLTRLAQTLQSLCLSLCPSVCLSVCLCQCVVSFNDDQLSSSAVHAAARPASAARLSALSSFL